MTTQDDDLNLEPPQAPPPAPPPVPATPQPPEPVVQQPQSELQPGQGRPLVEGPPMSVSEPVSDTAINRTAAFFGLGLIGIVLVVALVLILVIVFAICTHH
jgi:hypothetical protein